MPDPRITAVRALLVRAKLERPIPGPFGVLEARHNLIAVIETSDGVRGFGEVWANFPAWGCGERVSIVTEGLRPLLVGETLDDPARLYRRMWDRLMPLARQWGAPGPVNQAIAGVDQAVWDAHARTLGRPLADVLRGAAAPIRVPVYASGIGPGQPAADIAAARAAGHRRFKVRIAFGLEADRRTLAAGRKAAGQEPLMCDANQTYTPDAVVPLLPDLDRAQVGWVEEPFAADDLAANRAWSRISVLSLALGENIIGAAALRVALDDPAPAVLQPDISKTIGITEGIVIARRTVAAGRRLCLHMFGGPIGLLASAHLAASVPGADWLEMDSNPNPLFALLAEPLRVEGGALLLSGQPGLGVELDERALHCWATVH